MFAAGVVMTFTDLSNTRCDVTSHTVIFAAVVTTLTDLTPVITSQATPSFLVVVTTLSDLTRIVT